ncbi:hypothetical protein H5410_021676, partial [Solanum commersonii]
MSPICGLINTPNLNFCLSSSKLKFRHSKRVSQIDQLCTQDSCCDTLLPKILMLAILVTWASSSLIKNQESDALLTFKKRNAMHVFTHRFALIFQSTFHSAYSRSN